VDRSRFDIELLDDEDPFEIDSQRAHLAKHAGLDADDVREVWASDPLFLPSPSRWTGGLAYGCRGTWGGAGRSACARIDLEEMQARGYLRGRPRA
jgi:hypothetical protein